VLGEVLAETVEALLPGGAPLGDPALRGSQRTGLNGAGANPSHLFRADEPAVFEHVQVLDDRWHRHRQGASEFADGRRSAGQTFDHRPPAGVRERLEQKVDLPVGGTIGMGLLKHSLKYYHTRAGEAGTSSTAPLSPAQLANLLQVLRELRLGLVGLVEARADHALRQ